MVIIGDSKKGNKNDRNLEEGRTYDRNKNKNLFDEDGGVSVPEGVIVIGEDGNNKKYKRNDKLE